MRSLLIKVFLLVLLFVPFPVRAQATIHLTSVSVDIWPEYDQAAVLVIERLTLASGTNLPAAVNLKVPLGSQINAVAVIDSSGRLINAPYESTAEGNWSVLSVSTSSINLQVEYYQPLVKDGNIRHIVYDWPGNYPVDAFEVNFLLPSGSTNLTMNPPAASHAPGQDGLENYVVRTQNLSTGQSFPLKIDYQRQTDDLSISNLPVQAVTEPGLSTPGRVSMPVLLPWLLAGIGGLLVVGGVVGFAVWKRGSQATGQNKRRHEKHAAVSPVSTDAVYCHECGKRAQPGDIFCRTCGTRLRQEAKS